MLFIILFASETFVLGNFKLLTINIYLMNRLIIITLFLISIFHTAFAQTNHFRKTEAVYYQPVNSKKSPKNKALLEFRFFNPMNELSGTKDIELIVANDTFCFNSNKDLKPEFILDPGIFYVQVFSKWWKSWKGWIYVPEGQTTCTEIYFAPKENKLEVYFDLDKPVLYFYPDSTIEVSTKLVLTETRLGFTYPPYKNEWKFMAHPNGDIHINNMIYRYLFWEGLFKPEESFHFNSGFIVFRDSLIHFFETQLRLLGMNHSEMSDFITYWVPQMKNYDTLFIHFALNASCDRYCKLKIMPLPASINRCYIFWTPDVEKFPIRPLPQMIPTFNRDGFDVLEWGGCKY